MILKEDGTEAKSDELGRIVVKLPLPPGTLSTLYEAPERFCKIYFTRYRVRYIKKKVIRFISDKRF